ncbi:MAG TPA: glycosyl hydrolase-related protein, partial [Dehalococcoidia bacterium]|nr:glycosyl hydrolase-related protein [Dehalococcoidia bacterium]
YTLEVRLLYRLPRSLLPDRQGRSRATVACPITLRASLYPGVRRVDFAVRVVNRARDHRLRVLLPLLPDGAVVYAGSAFGALERPLTPLVGGEEWVEPPTAAAPMRGFVAVGGGSRGLMVAGRGLTEYEVLTAPQGPVLALTLLRCVGWLSRGDLATRPGNPPEAGGGSGMAGRAIPLRGSPGQGGLGMKGQAGPSILTPGAQCLGRYDFEYSLIPYSKGWGEAFAAAQAFLNPLRAFAVTGGQGSLPQTKALMSLHPESLAVSAVKVAEDRRGIVVRLCNPTARSVEGAVVWHEDFAGAEMVNLAEEPAEGLAAGEGHPTAWEPWPGWAGYEGRSRSPGWVGYQQGERVSLPLRPGGIGSVLFRAPP